MELGGTEEKMVNLSNSRQNGLKATLEMKKEIS